MGTKEKKSIKELLESYLKMQLLRFSVVGSVDDGKSTLIGRLLYDSKSIFIDQLKSVIKASSLKGKREINLAYFTDGLKLEREKGITIDVAYRYFYTPYRKFIIADTPGHFEYTRNMITGCSTSNVIIILIDVRNGITEQTKRHAFIASLMQVPHLIVCINKMDLVNYDKEKYYDLIKQFYEISSKLNINDITFIPISAKYGDNVVKRSKNTKWYDGPTLFWLLNNIYIEGDYNYVDTRLPVQFCTYHKLSEECSYGISGILLSGLLRVNDDIIIMPQNEKAKIVKIYNAGKECSEVYPFNNITIFINKKITVSRGNMISGENNIPQVSNNISAMFCWLSNIPSKNQEYIMFHTTNQVKCKIKEVIYKIDMNSLKKYNDEKPINVNEIGRFNIELSDPIFYDAYSKNKHTGSFILVCPNTNETVAAGMIV